MVPPSSDVGASGAPHFCSSGFFNMLWACHMFQSIWTLKHILYIYIYIYEFYVYFVDAIVLCVINASLEHVLRYDIHSDCDF